MVYVALLRGINVGGKNKIAMAQLKSVFEGLGFKSVRSYINSGNIIFEDGDDPQNITKRIEAELPKHFELDSLVIKVLVVSQKQLAGIVTKAPKDFGQHPDTYHSDVIFLIDKTADEAMHHVEVHPEVDKAWPGDGVLYFQRLSAKRTKSRLSKVISKPVYQNMTIRSWNTATKLLSILKGS